MAIKLDVQTLSLQLLDNMMIILPMGHINLIYFYVDCFLCLWAFKTASLCHILLIYVDYNQ